MVQYGMIINLNQCQGCSICLFACKDEFVGNDWAPYSRAQPDTEYSYYGTDSQPDGVNAGGVAITPGQTWMKDIEIVSGTYPSIKAQYVMLPCMECANAPCMTAATNGAVYRTSNGTVIIDPVLSVGQTQIVDACPYGRIYWNSTLQIPQSCTFCAHRTAAGMNPKCVDSCPMSAITFGDLSNPKSAISVLKASTTTAAFHPEYGTSPNVFYVGLITGTQYQ
jgi:Fe-S-cluster-containing dehydrogenase component